MSAPATISLPPRLWSYGLLKDAQVLIPCNAEGAVDLTRIGPISIEHYSPEYGLGHLHMRAPTEVDIARWLFGLPVALHGYFDRYPERAAKVRRVFESFVMADELRRRALREAHRRGADAVRCRKRLDHETRKHRTRLRAALRMGLERRLGRLLEGEERTWIAFAARDHRVAGIRVCEQCSLVFHGRSTTRRCPDCNRAPVTPKVRPAIDGGWHVDVRVGGRWSIGEFDRTITYWAICQGCDRRFWGDDPRRRYCENCSSDSGRKRRQRHSRASTGRKEFSYISTSDEPLLSVGVTGPDGQGINMTAIDGVVRTTDLEYAHQLDANASVRRIDQP